MIGATLGYSETDRIRTIREYLQSSLGIISTHAEKDVYEEYYKLVKRIFEITGDLSMKNSSIEHDNLIEVIDYWKKQKEKK